MQIAYVGICPWDVRVYAGKKSVPLPRVMGHEAAGRIVAVGSEVKHFKPGQRVMADFIVKCGACDPCRTGRSNRCQHPRFPNGAYEEYAVLPQRNIFPIREDTTSYRAAAFTEPLACVVRGQKMLHLTPGRHGVGDWRRTDRGDAHAGGPSLRCACDRSRPDRRTTGPGPQVGRGRGYQQPGDQPARSRYGRHRRRRGRRGRCRGGSLRPWCSKRPSVWPQAAG